MPLSAFNILKQKSPFLTRACTRRRTYTRMYARIRTRRCSCSSSYIYIYYIYFRGGNPKKRAFIRNKSEEIIIYAEEIGIYAEEIRRNAFFFCINPKKRAFMRRKSEEMRVNEEEIRRKKAAYPRGQVASLNYE